MTQNIIDNIAFYNEVICCMDGDSTVVCTMDCTSTYIGLVHIASQVEVKWISTQLEGLDVEKYFGLVINKVNINTTGRKRTLPMIITVS